MPILRITLSLVALFFSSLIPAFSEGTKQIMPFSNAKGQLCIDKSRNDFAFYDASPEFRLNIYIASVSEKICFGFGMMTLPDSTATIEFRIKAPDGSVAFGPTTVPFSGSGFINSYNQAVIGPFFTAGGYDPVVFQPLMTGNYYFEFYYPPSDTGGYSEGSRCQFSYFDITVKDPAGRAIDGRVWSKAWQFNSGNVDPPPSLYRFYAKMNILSDDSIVTQVDCNGFIGGTFSISSNQTGCSTTGNFLTDRLSTPGFNTYPQYKIFLNDPDSTVFPTGKLVSGIIPPVTVTPNCATGAVDFGVRVARDGMVELLIDVNLSVSPDPLDVRVTAPVLANPGGGGFNIIHWNGLNSSMVPVPNGTPMNVQVSYVSGLTHLPIYDIEYNDNGYKVMQIRPSGSQLKIYWDDSLLPFGTSNTVEGCDDSFGCHTWGYDIGNINTINSWWYVSRNNIPSIPFVITRKPAKPLNINGPFSICKGSKENHYSITPDPSSSEYFWSFSGSGATITATGSSISIDLSDSASSGILSVFGRNPDCGDGQACNVNISVNPIPKVTLQPFDSVCFNKPEFPLTGGLPLGGIFTIDGLQSERFNPQNESRGLHTIIYTYTATTGCSSSDTMQIAISVGHECDPVFYIPNAFSPNGDGLNDVYKPVVRNVYKFLMQIYNRQGELIFSGNDFNTGWDGTFNGQRCPTGVYLFKVTYENSPSGGELSTFTGTVTLI